MLRGSLVHGQAGLLPLILPLVDQIDTTARRLHFSAGSQICGAGRQAESAVDTTLEQLLGDARYTGSGVNHSLFAITYGTGPGAQG